MMNNQINRVKLDVTATKFLINTLLKNYFVNKPIHK